MSEPLKVGLVGAGPWANMVHAPVIANHPETQLVGVWARRAEAAAETAGRNNAQAFGSFDELLEQVDAVAFCVPPNVQAELAITAAKAGKTLLLEKPIALELDAAERLVAAVDEAGVGTVVLLSMRYAQPVKDFLASVGSIGRPLGGRVAWVSGALKPESPFATPWRLERGALLDLGPHAIDIIDAALGAVVGVKAGGDLQGWISLILEHESGATSNVGLCATAGIASRSGIEVFGEDGELELDLRSAADATSMMNVPAALAAVARGEKTDAPDIHRGLHLQRIINNAEGQLR